MSTGDSPRGRASEPSRDVPPSAPRVADRRALLVIITICVCLFVYFARRFYGSTIDDVYITYRYAVNFARGEGLVFNPGELPRAEGLTSLAYGVILSVAPRLGLDIVTASRWLGILVAVPTTLLIARLARAVVGEARVSWGVAATLGCAAYLADPYIAGHAVSGMETALGATAVALFGLVAVRAMLPGGDPRRRSVALGLAALLPMLMRPELGLLVGLVLLLGLIALPEARRRLFVAGCIAGIVGGCYFAARYRYYEMPLPLPFYHKQRLGLNGLGPFLEYLRDSLLLAPLVLAAIVGVIRRIRDEESTRARVLLVLAVATLAQVSYYITIIHIMGLAHRFFQPIHALVVTLALVGVYELVALWRARFGDETRGVVGSAAALLVANLATFPVARAVIEVRLGVAEARGVARSQAIREAADGRVYSMAINDCGRIPYFSEFQVVDLAGLNNRALSQNRTSEAVYAEVDRVKPDFIVLNSVSAHDPGSLKHWERLDERALGQLKYHYVGAIEARPTYFYLFFARDDRDYEDFFRRLVETGEFTTPGGA